MSTVTDASFDKVTAMPLAIVMFWQPECAPCKELIHTLIEVAKKFPSVQFILMNKNDNPKTAARYEVVVCPTLVMIKKGTMAGRWLGAASEQRITSWVERTSGVHRG